MVQNIPGLNDCVVDLFDNSLDGVESKEATKRGQGSN